MNFGHGGATKQSRARNVAAQRSPSNKQGSQANKVRGDQTNILKSASAPLDVSIAN
jgi:hypothetical protein